jgi:hypothetical protein
MIASVLLVAAFAPSITPWPPAEPAVHIGSSALVEGQVSVVLPEPAAGVCAIETHTVATDACRLVRKDGGAVGFETVGGSGRACKVEGEAVDALERRFVFDQAGNLRELIEIDRRTARAGGKMVRWENDRLARVEHWSDFKSGSPTRVDTWAYDEAGNAVEFTTQLPPSAARRWQHAWSDGQLRSTTDPATGATWSYDWVEGRPTAIRERRSASEPVVELRYGWGQGGRLESQERMVGTERLAWTGFSYDAESRLVSRGLDDRGASTPAAGSAAPTGSEVAAIGQRPDGQWDEVTRYYYDCSWLTAPAAPAQPVPAPGAVTAPAGTPTTGAPSALPAVTNPAG